MYANVATAIPAAVAINASEIAGATTLKEALDCVPSFVNVSSMPITVPNSPIKGEVEAIMDNMVSPLVETRIASEEAASNIALLGIVTRDR